MAKIYVTKYALSSGIFSAEAQVSTDGKRASYKQEGGYFDECAHGQDFHLTEELALKRAEEMRIKKLKSLDKQIKKVSAIKFEIK